ncbi:diaminopropionate ammonia-lyase [Pseudogracilibacillus auburnensis]|uniref:Diaminopropionate ammonia-lyase n=1 Tax=Pseudogracilibacillus auburnensis TaxID=1494959 RepID=A0A2V3VWN9_9BACI|nr:diaminopropionate ammonia-lyase [Pseudogracilibacillus auburnensis]PXW85271.1 diaminopropionate ammonia-lyase [Pseudogracilibacillus auburnensis]
MEKVLKNDIAFVKNKHYSPTYNEKELIYFNKEEIKKVKNFQQTHEAYEKTPLHSLDQLASYFNVADMKIKDEAYRFGLNAFKVLGGIYAIGKYIAEQLEENIDQLSFSQLKEVSDKIGQLTFISATDGNHGKGVAWAARELGQNSVIYLPKGSSQARLDAIRNEGADAAITDKNYDDTVKMCAELADKNGWVMVQDTAWEGYDKIPLWIMQGYATIAAEAIEELEGNSEQPPTHIFVQAGVGSFAAGIAGYFTQYYRDNPPKIIIVEPHLANCYYRSFSNKVGEMEIVTGHMDSIMAGLCCGAPNTRAFRILSQYANASFSLDDKVAALGMRILGNPLGQDPKITSGESGAAVAVGLLHTLNEKNEVREEIGLHENSRVLCINTEGDTDFDHYLDVVWKGIYPTQ